MDASCINCLFFNDLKMGDGYTGQCRRQPPVVRPTGLKGRHDPRYSGVFPEVDSDDWCGEFRHKQTGAGLQ